MITTVTACLITYKRPENIGPIVTHLLAQPFIGEVLIRDQEKAINLRCFGRYQLAERQARNNLCYVQDDDCIVEDIGLLYKEFLTLPDRITFGLAPSHAPLWEKGTFTYPEAQLAMVGWGAFFNREWIRPAFNRFTRNTQRSDENESYVCREADRIFSLMMGCQHNPVLTPNLRHLPGASEEGNAMWLEKDHFASRDRVIERCLKILREK